MRKVFLSLISKIDKSDYSKSLKEAFAELTSQARYYSDTEFKEHFCNADVYNQHACHYLLYRLENYEHPKEQIPLQDCTKERIMPEKMTEEWRKRNQVRTGKKCMTNTFLRLVISRLPDTIQS